MWFTRSEFDREACFHAVGGVRGSLEWEDFCGMKLPIPSPEKQLEIVKEYNTIQNRISLNNQFITKLEKTAQAIYKQWFIDFEFPDENGKPYKCNGGEMVWCEELEKDIPKGWSVKYLGDISDVIDSLHVTPKYSTDGHPMIRVTDISNGFLDLTKSLKVDEKVYKEFTKKYQPKKNDILMSRVGTYGICSFVGTNKKFCLGQNTIVICSKKISSQLIFLAMQNQPVQQQIEEVVTGSTQKTISLASIRSLKLVLPNDFNINLFSKFNNHIVSVMKFGNIIHDQIMLFRELNESLLARMTKVETEK
jgi:type I restriction enzyme S subunit